MAALTGTAAQRRDIYNGFARRNRIVGLLRVLVPGIGVVVFALLAGSVVIANLAENFSIGRISLESDRMVVETPSYSGVTGNGSIFTVTALSAEAGLSATGAITLNGAVLVIEDGAGVETTARAARAELETSAQTVAVAGLTTFSNSTGMTGSMHGMDIDFPTQVVTARDAVDFEFPGGQRLIAETMRYDGASGLWNFTGVTLTLPGTPATPPPSALPVEGLAPR